MQLSRIQIAILRAYREYRRGGFSIATMYRHAWRRLLVAATCALLLIGLLIAVGAGWAAAIAGSMLLGAALRDIAYIRQARAAWPLMERIISWETVDELLADPPRPPS